LFWNVKALAMCELPRVLCDKLSQIVDVERFTQEIIKPHFFVSDVNVIVAA